MTKLRGIVSVAGGAASIADRQLLPILQAQRQCSIVSVQGVIGQDCDPLALEDALERAERIGRPVIVRFHSSGGCLDDVVECLIPAIQRAKIACGTVIAFVEQCQGAAFLAAAECERVIAAWDARIGHFAVKATSRAWGDESIVAERLAFFWQRILERRPIVSEETLDEYATKSMTSEWAESAGLIDEIGSLGEVVAGHV